MNSNQDKYRPIPRFITIQDAESWWAGDYSKAIYPGDPGYDTAIYEIGVVRIDEHHGWSIPAGPTAIGAFHSPSQVERIDNLE